MFGVYRNPDLTDNICLLLTAMAQVKSVDRKASFLFVGDVNAHHEERLRSPTTNLHGRAARDLPHHRVVQMVTEATHINGGAFDLVLTDVPDVLAVRVGLPVGTSNHSAIL